MPGSCTFGGTSAGIVHTTDQGGEGQDRDGDGVQRDSPFGWATPGARRWNGRTVLLNGITSDSQRKGEPGDQL